MATTSNEIFRVGDVSLCELKDDSWPRPPWLVVLDDRPSFRVRFYTNDKDEPPCVRVGFDCAMDEADHALYGMANYTADFTTPGMPTCAIGEVTITDDGLLSVLARHRAFHDFRMGWTAQLPVEAVAVIRRAIEIAEARAQGEAIAG